MSDPVERVAMAVTMALVGIVVYIGLRMAWAVWRSQASPDRPP